MNKVELLEVSLYDENPDVFCLSEYSVKRFGNENLTIIKTYTTLSDLLLLQNTDE